MLRRFLLVLLLFAPLGAFSQQGNTVTIPFVGPPTGTCGPLMLGLDTTSGTLYGCSGSSWVAGGGILVVTNAPTGACTAGTQPQMVSSTGTIYTCQSLVWAPITSVANANGIVTSGLIGEYAMTEGSGTTIFDTSGNGNNGTFCAAAPTWIANTGGLQFVGSSHQCVTLPSAVNAAKTILLYIGYIQANQVNTYNAPIIGNGNTTSQTTGIILTYNSNASQAGTIPFKGAVRVTPWSTGGFPVFGKQIWNGLGALALTMDNSPALGHIYINGKEEQTYAVQVAGTVPNASGVYQLGGAAAGSGAPAATWYTGNIYFAAFWNRTLNAAEIAQSTNAIVTALSYRYLPGTQNQVPVMGFSNPTDELVADGDSITYGYSGSTPFNNYANAMTLNGTWNVDDLALPGFRLGCYAVPCSIALLPSQDQGMLPAYNPQAARNAVIVWAGTNDIALGSRAPSEVHGMLRNYCRGAQQLGFKCIVATMISRTGQDANKNTYNTLIRQFWPGYADALADIAADPNLGADGASANTTYFLADAIHPTQFGIYTDEVPVMQRAVNRLFGNRDFSSANVYASAAAAATATTAGSETGNTVTLTFATAPCVAGNTVTVAGVTPAGYNGTYTVLTRNATTLTYYNNTSGLGAVTVQGTAVCAQQQDVDTYSVLNFGAGNFTLESCVGYTGQNIYIKNINAGASTIVPFGSETIDGAANLTIASKATVVLQSILTSASAAGCSWKQLQNN